jgi:hypothetical protein
MVLVPLMVKTVCRVALVSKRNIIKGEVLYWDYGANIKENEHYLYFKMASDVPK